MDFTRYHVDMYRNCNYTSGEGELEATPFFIGAILRDDSGEPHYRRRRMQELGEAAEVGVIGLGRRWRMQDGKRIGKPCSLLVRIEIYDVGVTVFEANKAIEVDVDGKKVRPIFGRGELCGRSLTFELHPETTDESGASWRPAFVDVGPVVFDPFVYVRNEEVLTFPPETEPLSAEEFFPYDD